MSSESSPQERSLSRSLSRSVTPIYPLGCLRPVVRNSGEWPRLKLEQEAAVCNITTFKRLPTPGIIAVVP